MSRAVCIDSSLIGTERNLLVDDGYKWVDEIPDNVWHLSGRVKLHSDWCLDTLLKLEQSQHDFLPPHKFIKALSTVFSGSLSEVPWSHVMPSWEHRAFVKNVVNRAVDAIGCQSKDYYVNTWVSQSTVLRSLQPAKISKKRYEECLRDAGTNSKSLEGFAPGRTGHALPIQYERFGTRTGRLTVSSGPGILTLKREYRNVVIPSEEGGNIVYIDFAALEARIVLYEAGGRCDAHDLYDNISKEVFGNKVSRNSVKIAVISELYGSGKTALGESLGISGNELDEFVGKVRRYFKTDDLKNRVKEQFVKEGYITNRHGRRINIDEPIDRIFVNSYVQSTGVDVALLGFSEIVKSLSKFPRIRPLFVLHDALILDVPGDCVEEIKGITHVKVPGYVQKFPLKCEIFLYFEHLQKSGYIFTMSLTAEDIEKNYNKYRSLCEKLGDRSEAALRLVDGLGDRLAVCPASAKKEYHNAFPGGLVEHSLRVLSNAMALTKAYGWQVPKDSLIIACLFHDLGKVGNHEADYYVPADPWRAEKLGEMYGYNKEIQYMTVPLRGLFLCQHYGLKLTQEEMLAIFLNDGQYAQENAPYKLKEPMLADVVHMADLIATKQEKGMLPLSIIFYCMSLSLLKNYIRLLFENGEAPARVADQLMSPEEVKKKKKDKKHKRKPVSDEEMKEFSGVGSIAGYTAPLGATSQDMGAEKGKKKEPGWSLFKYENFM